CLVVPPEGDCEVGMVHPGTAFDLERGLLQPVTAEDPLDRHTDIAAEHPLRGSCAPRRMLHHLLHPVQLTVVADPVDEPAQWHVRRVQFTPGVPDEFVKT